MLGAMSLRHVSDTYFCIFWIWGTNSFGIVLSVRTWVRPSYQSSSEAAWPKVVCRQTCLSWHVDMKFPQVIQHSEFQETSETVYSSDVSSWICPKTSISGMECFKLIPGQHLFRSLQGPSADLMVVLTKGKIRAGEKCLEAPRVICGFDSGLVWTLNNVFLDVSTDSE